MRGLPILSNRAINTRNIITICIPPKQIKKWQNVLFEEKIKLKIFTHVTKLISFFNLFPFSEIRFQIWKIISQNFPNSTNNLPISETISENIFGTFKPIINFIFGNWPISDDPVSNFSKIAN